MLLFIYLGAIPTGAQGLFLAMLSGSLMVGLVRPFEVLRIDFRSAICKARTLHIVLFPSPYTYPLSFLF